MSEWRKQKYYYQINSGGGGGRYWFKLNYKFKSFMAANLKPLKYPNGISEQRQFSRTEKNSFVLISLIAMAICVHKTKTVPFLLRITSCSVLCFYRKRTERLAHTHIACARLQNKTKLRGEKRYTDGRLLCLLSTRHNEYGRYK